MKDTSVKTPGITDLETRKKELKKELSDIENDLGSAFSDLQNDIKEKANIWYWIKKYPVSALTTSLLIGLLAGKRKSNPSGSGAFSGEVVNEIKKVAMRKAIQAVVRQIEEGNQD